MKRLPLTLLLFIFAGCVNAMFVNRVGQKPEVGNSTAFLIGKELNINVGDVMVVNQPVFFYDGFLTSADYQAPDRPLLRKDAAFKVYGRLIGGDLLLVNMQNLQVEIDVNERYQADKAGGQAEIDKLVDFINERVWPQCIAINASNEAYGEANCALGNVIRWPAAIALKKGRVRAFGNFKRMLIYAGRSGSTVKLLYREIDESNRIRQAFTQEFIYDLSGTKTVGFQGMVMDVIEATNSSIRFVVKSAWD